MLALLALLCGVSIDDLSGAVWNLPPIAYASIAAAQASLILLAAWKWHMLLCATSADPPSFGLRDAVAATTLGTLAGQVLPLQIITPAVRAWAGRKHGIPASYAIGTSVFEQLFEVIVLASMAGAGILASVMGAGAGLALAGFLLLVLLFSIAPALGLGAAILAATGSFGPPLLHRLGEGMRQAQSLPRGLLARLMGLSTLRYGLMVWLNVQILGWLVPGVPLLPLALAFPLVQAVTALPLVTGGLGMTEATWIGVLVASGIAAPEAAEAALALRIISTAGFLMTVPFLITLRTRPARRIT